MSGEPCTNCNGSGWVCEDCLQPGDACTCPSSGHTREPTWCQHCNGTGKEPITESDATSNPDN